SFSYDWRGFLRCAVRSSCEKKWQAYREHCDRRCRHRPTGPRCQSENPPRAAVWLSKSRRRGLDLRFGESEESNHVLSTGSAFGEVVFVIRARFGGQAALDITVGKVGVELRTSAIARPRHVSATQPVHLLATTTLMIFPQNIH